MSNLIPASKFWISIEKGDESVWNIPALSDYLRPGVFRNDRLSIAYDTSLQAERAYVGCDGLDLDALIEEGDITLMLKQLARYINSTYINDMHDMMDADFECLDILKRILPESVANVPTTETIKARIDEDNGGFDVE